MKFYNPFKWHVWQSSDNGLWYVRRWSLWFEYLDQITFDVWTYPMFVNKYASHSTKQKAENTLERFKELEKL